MQFNTALGFLFSGIGLLTFGGKNLFFTKLSGFLVAILGGLTLIQYIFGINLKIDNFFIDGSTVITNVSHVGRMAPNTAICFLIAGLGLIFSKKEDTAFAFSFSVLFLSLFSLLAYSVLDKSSVSYLSLTRMALHTTLCFLVFSLSFLVFLKSKKEIAKAFYMQVEKDEAIIFSCGSGITACVLALGAEVSGYKNISVYDGSWTEYAELRNLKEPIV